MVRPSAPDPDGRDPEALLASTVERFEDAWEAGPPPGIDPFLPEADGALRRAIAIELVMIDLEYRWSRGARPERSGRAGAGGAGGRCPSGPPSALLVEDYLARHAVLGPRERLPVALIGQEYRVRRRWGDRPAPEEFLARFPEAGESLRAALERIDGELSAPEVGPLPANGPVPPDPYGRYRLIRILGYGGIGRVWLAYDRQLDREVALKEILPQRVEDGELHARFLREARITGGLQHPGIVPVHDLAFRSDTGRAFYVMPCLRGRTLSEAIGASHRRRGPAYGSRLERAKLLEALISVCNTVGYAHARGVVHRDLKGSNVILGPFGEVVVLDWGFAKEIHADRRPDPESDGSGPDRPSTGDAWEAPAEFRGTMQGQVLGTPTHMSPEQAQRRYDLVGPRSDVFSLGAILYEILTGRPPFVGKIIEEILGRVCACAFEPPRRLDRSVPRALEAVCLKSMARDPADRYESALALADDLRRWRADEPVSAMREPRTARARRWITRHQT